MQFGNPAWNKVQQASLFLQNGYEKCAAEYQIRIKALNERSQSAQPKVTYEYYDDAQASEQVYTFCLNLRSNVDIQNTDRQNG
jgi:hypothetical protein